MKKGGEKKREREKEREETRESRKKRKGREGDRGLPQRTQKGSGLVQGNPSTKAGSTPTRDHFLSGPSPVS